MSASTAPLPQDVDGLRAQNRALRSLCASLEAVQAIQTAQGQKYHEAITTLDSEREANERLTNELEGARKLLERCAQIIERNLYRQHEKIEDVPKLVRAFLTPKEPQ